MLSTKKVQDGMTTKWVVVDENGNEDSSPKAFKRLKIQNEVFDDKDAIADNAKMISLLTNIVSELWDLIDEDKKNSIEPNKLELIEHTFSKFKETKTVADNNIEKSSTKLVNKLFERQDKIGKIVK